VRSLVRMAIGPAADRLSAFEVLRLYKQILRLTLAVPVRREYRELVS
jgi:hypothetical protein